MTAPIDPAAASNRSELEKLIARFTSQRACLNHAAKLIAQVPGVVLELGLGKGRTFDHLRKILPEREIFAFDLVVHAPAHCQPAPDHMVIGDFLHTLPHFHEQAGVTAALVHADIGSLDRAADGRLAAQLSPLVEQVVAPGSVIISDRPLTSARWQPLELPKGCEDWPYFMQRVPF